MYSQDKAAEVCARIEDGIGMRKACEAAGIKHPTFLLWVKQNAELADQYARALEIGNAIEFEGLIDLVDEAPEKTASGAVDTGWVAWQRNRIDVRKWALSKREPKKYGDKIEHDHKGGLNIALSPTENRL